jgi:hypothetical protein
MCRGLMSRALWSITSGVAGAQENAPLGCDLDVRTHVSRDGTSSKTG